MSADNWTQCPKCIERRRQEIEEYHAKLREEYGKIPSDEWLAKREHTPNSEVDESLREDWDIGFHGGVFGLSYYARCTAIGCDYRVQYTPNHPEKLLTEQED